MFWNPGAILMTAVLVWVTGYVIKSIILSMHRERGQMAATPKVAELEERIKNLETATTSLLVDVTSMREKERFMAKLQAGSGPREAAAPPARGESDISPMMTQSIPIMPKARL